MKNWKHKESGPICHCGQKTYIDISDKPLLICLNHTNDEGYCWRMPAVRPKNWPNLSEEEMEALVKNGYQEYLADHIATQDIKTLRELED